MVTPGKRHYKRFSVEDIAVYAKALLTADVELLNISVTGACITVHEGLQGGDKYIVKLVSSPGPLFLNCSIIWENSDFCPAGSGGRQNNVYAAGIAFRNISPDKLVRLKDFIRLSGEPTEQKDEYGQGALRFRIRANEKAVLYYIKTLSVKKIGFGGMLIEFPGKIQTGKKFPMALFFPYDTLPIKFAGRIASCIKNESKCFDAGVEFLDLKEADKSRLSNFLQLLSGKKKN